MQKAKIIVVKGWKKASNKEKEIEVRFNPTEYTLDKSNEFANINIPGLESPLLQFTRGGLQTLTTDLFFDSYETGEDVRKKYVDRVAKLMEIDEDLHAPPVCEFVWGDGIKFTCVVSKVTKKFTMFNSDGAPVRATLSVTFNEYKTEAELKKPTSSPDRTKVYTFKEGDSLWAIAWEQYGDAGQWRSIAEANDMDNPRLIPVGKQIEIPPLEK
jgi:hypothetical protein